MAIRRIMLALAAGVLLPPLAACPPVLAETLRERIAAAQPGAVIILETGTHAGPVTIDKPLTLEGRVGAKLEGPGAGRVLTVDSPGVTVRGLTVTGSGLSLATEGSGIFLTENATGAVVEDNHLVNNLIGVNIKGAADSIVRGNVIEGRTDLRLNERGNGVQVWNAPGAQVTGNVIRHGRDGIFTTTSRDNLFARNRFEGVRFAVHYMYTNNSVIEDNVSIGNHIGYALMYSKRITARNNRSINDRDHGLMLNYANYGTIVGNSVEGGAEKCVFIYNANINTFRDNRFEGCGIGIHFTGGSERNAIAGNAFVRNRTQVKYVGTKDVVWTEDGRGNYWSDHAAFDLDDDGIADKPYRPNGLMDQVVWRAPEAKLLLSSPAVQILNWAQQAFPAIRPGGVVDTAPLMRPPEGGAPHPEEGRRPVSKPHPEEGRRPVSKDWSNPTPPFETARTVPSQGEGVMALENDR